MKKQSRKIVIHLFYDKSEVRIFRRVLFFWVREKVLAFNLGTPEIRKSIATHMADRLADQYEITCDHVIKNHL